MNKFFATIFTAITLLFSCNGSVSDKNAAADDAEAGDTISEPLSENPLEENQISADSAQNKEKADSIDAALSPRSGNYIYISKPQMRLYVLDKNDSVLFTCGIACGLRRGNKAGKGDYRTPEGSFHINGIYHSTDWIHKTRSGRKVKGCYGPFFLSLATGRFAGIGIHGTNAPGSIGSRASEGCIRVKTPNIIHIKDNYAYVGMPVIVSAENERLPLMKGIPQSDTSTPAAPADKETPENTREIPADSLAPSDAPTDHGDPEPLPDSIA